MFKKPTVPRWDMTSFSLPVIQAEVCNGWTVVHHFDDSNPIVSLRLLVTGGTQQSNKGGVEYLTDALLVHHLQKNWREHLLSGNLRHTIQEDYSSFSLDGLISEWPQMCRTINTLFHNATLDLEYGRHLRRIRIEEIEHESHNPQSLINWAVLEILYPNSEMSTGAYGSIRSLNSISDVDIEQSLKRYRSPSGIVLITGGISRQSVLDWVNASLPKAHQQKIKPTPPIVTPSTYFVSTPVAHSQTLIQSIFPASNATKHLLSNELISLNIGELFTSRLNQNLRVKHGITYGISSSIWDIENHPLFVVQTMVDKQQQETALSIIQETIRQAHQGWTEEDLNIAKRHLCQQLISYSNSAHDLANLLYQWLASGSTLKDFNQITQHIKETDLDKITSAATSLSQHQGMHILVGSSRNSDWKLHRVQKMLT